MQNRALIPLLMPLCLFAGASLGAAAQLPLTLGYYVESGESCGAANDATVAYLHEGGLNSRFGLCAFDSLTESAKGLWDYTATCGGGEEAGEITTKGQISVKSKSAFNLANGEQELDYSYCPNDQLPAQYRTP